MDDSYLTTTAVELPHPVEETKRKKSSVRKYLENKVERALSNRSESPDGSHVSDEATLVEIKSIAPSEAEPRKASSSNKIYRRSSYGPDFLEQFANKYMGSRREKGERRKLKLVTGPTAVKYYQNFVGQDNLKSPMAIPPKPIVFAFTSKAGCVKFYKTWRQKSEKKPQGYSDKVNKGIDHNLGFLDSEFDRVMGFLDTEFNRLSTASVASAVTVKSIPYLRPPGLNGSDDGAPSRRGLIAVNGDALSSKASLLGPSPLRETSRPINDDDATTPTATSFPLGALCATNPDTTPISPIDENFPSTTRVSRLPPPVSQDTGLPVIEIQKIKRPPPSILEVVPPRASKRRAQTDDAISEDRADLASDVESKPVERRRSVSLSSQHSKASKTSKVGKDKAEFVIVLLNNEKDYKWNDKDRKSSKAPSIFSQSTIHEDVASVKAADDNTPWWAADLGDFPPPARTSSNASTKSSKSKRHKRSASIASAEVPAYWSPETIADTSRNASPANNNTPSPERSNSRGSSHRPSHPAAGVATWKSFMDEVGYPKEAPPGFQAQQLLASPYTFSEPDLRVIHAQDLTPRPQVYPLMEYSHSSPVIHQIVASPYGYAKPLSVYEASPYMVYGSAYSGHVSLPPGEPVTWGSPPPVAAPLYADRTGYPYASPYSHVSEW